MSTIGTTLNRAGLNGILSWPFRHIRWKIVFPYAILTGVLAALGAFIFTDLVTGSLTERFDNQLAEAGRVTADAVVQKERDHLDTVRAITFTEGVREAIETRDRDRLQALVKPLAANWGVERAAIVDASGQSLLSLELADRESLTYQASATDDDPSSWPIVETLIAGQEDASGDKQAQIVETAQAYVLYTGGPVYADGNVVGAVLVGTTLPTFIEQTKEAALADVTIYGANGDPLASTFKLATGALSAEAELKMPPEIVADSVNGTVVREERDLFKRSYSLVYGQLRVRDQIVGIYSVALPSDFIFDAGAATRTKVVVLFGLGMAAVIAVGLYITHKLTKPILRLVSTARVVSAGDLTARSGIESSDEIGVLAHSFDDMTARLQRQHLATIRALTSAIDARDPYTAGHSLRVGQISVMMGKQFDLDDKVLSQIEIGGYLHDVGKIGIRDSILLKPGRLTPEERAAIEEHPRIGLSILDPVELSPEVIEFVSAHHERLDGSGYPRGLRGSEVPLIARIAAVADMYDALTTHRPYRDPMTPDDALALLRSQAGQLLDPQVISAFATILRDWEIRRSSEPALQGFQLPDVIAKTTIR